MAIYHLSAQVISRGAGGNAKAAAAYRSGEKVSEFDYSSRERTVDYTNILAPENAPGWCFEREKLWEAVEVSEKRKDAQLCREFNLALPLELKPSERVALVQDYAKKFVALGMVADVSIHDQGGHNPHAHMMLTLRELTPEGFGKKNRDWNRRELLQEWREQWAELANRALERAGHDVRIDHRSLAAQGIDREPTRHQGKAVTAMERKGRQTLVGSLNAAIRQQAQDAHEVPRCRAELATLERLEREQAEQPQKGPEMPLKDAEPKRAAQRPLEQEKPSTGQTRAATPPEKAEPLKGAELLPVIDRLRRETREANAAFQAAIAEERQAASALADARKAIEQHNAEFKQTGFFKKAWKSAEINARAEKLSEAEKVAAVTSEAAKEKKAQASRAYHARQAEFEKMLAEYENSPHGLEVKAEKRREMERRRAEKETTRQQSRSMDRGR